MVAFMFANAKAPEHPSTSLAVGLLVVVARPARARTMLPVATVLAGALFITAVIDLVNGKVPLIDETSHLPELLSVVLIWLLAVPSPRRAAAADGAPGAHGARGAPMLRAVTDSEPRRRASGD